MKAIVVSPGVKDSVHIRDMPEPRPKPDQVAVKMIRVGLCATDAEINDGQFGEAPPGEEFLILGHENFGVVEAIGKSVKRFKPGDFVVATVRRPCGVCYNCAHGENDLCTSGRYEERGILRRHGYMAQHYVESPQWLHKIPRAIHDVGVLVEPVSVVEKAIDHAFRLQMRLRWKPASAVVLGGGSIGLLAAALLRLRGLDTHVVSREPDTDIRAQITRHMGATFHSVATKTVFDIHKELPLIDLAIEATGVAAVAFEGMQILGPNGVMCLLSSTPGNQIAQEPVDRINQRLMLGNRVVFGSVNANRRHFLSGVKDLTSIQAKWPGLLGQMITTRLPWEQYRRWFDWQRTGTNKGIKTTLEIGS